MTTTTYSYGPGATPKPLKFLIALTCIVALLAAFSQPIAFQLFGTEGLQNLLSLSVHSLTKYGFPLLTYPLIIQGGEYGLSLYFLINLFFQMYILWFMGTEICEYISSKTFYAIYFSTAIISALATLTLMWIVGSTQILVGPTPSILAVMTIWTLFYPDRELLLFFIIPVKAKWILAAIWGIVLLMNVSQLNLILPIFYLSGSFLGYLWASFGWELKSPYPFLEPLDRAIFRIGKKIAAFASQRHRSHRNQDADKIVRLHSTERSQKEADEQFMDEMLAKISEKGEGALTPWEKRRMDSISSKKT